MYQLFTVLARHDLVARQLPSFTASFVIASLFYRFGSFALESVAFLATWFAIDALWGIVEGTLGLERSTAGSADEKGLLPAMGGRRPGSDANDDVASGGGHGRRERH